MRLFRQAVAIIAHDSVGKFRLESPRLSAIDDAIIKGSPQDF